MAPKKVVLPIRKRKKPSFHSAMDKIVSGLHEFALVLVAFLFRK